MASTMTEMTDPAGRAGDGKTALALAREFAPDAAVLDIMLPDLDGFELLRRLRAHVPDMPALFLTARDSLEDRVIAFVAGACVSDPFSLDEVVARVRTMLLRSGAAKPVNGDPVIRIGDLALDEERHEVHRGGELIDLTSIEFKLLRYLMSNRDRVLSKAEILFAVWNYDFGGASDIVELYVSHLQQKISNGGPPMIFTVPDVGYLLKSARSEPGSRI